MAETVPDAMRELGDRLDREVASTLESALALLAEVRAVDQTNLASVAPHMAVSHATAVEFVEERLRARRGQLRELRQRLERAAEGRHEAA